MKLYGINNWDNVFENSRSRAIEKLSWVATPNKHDGETYSLLIADRDGAILFATWNLLIQVASKCKPRGTLVKGDGTPHNATSLSLKCRAPITWFEKTLQWLEAHSDWLVVVEVSESDTRVIPKCQAGVIEGKERKEGKEGTESPAAPSARPTIREVFDHWNGQAHLTRTLVMSDKRRRFLMVRVQNPYFCEHWKEAIARIQSSPFLMGVNERAWRATFDWFIRPDTVAKIMEGHYHRNGQPKQNDIAV
jgi:hypothetical protein